MQKKPIIKILHVITGLGKGGAETMLYNILQARDQISFRHTIISLTPGGYYVDKIRALGCAVHDFDFRKLHRLPYFLSKAIGLLRNIRPSVVQGWMYHGNIAALLLKMLSRNKAALVWNIRHSLHFFALETFFTRFIIRLNRLLSRAVRCCVFNSRHSLNQHIAFGFSPPKTAFIPNGFDTDRFRIEVPARLSLRSRLGIPAHVVVIGAVGRNHPLKDYPVFFQAIAELEAGSPSLQFICIMAGKGLNRDWIERQDPGTPGPVRQRFHLLGESDEIPALMNAFDVLCLSSRSEAFPNVVGEAMSCGVPCVVTDVGDSGYLVGDTGIIVPPRDPQALAQGLLRLVSLLPEERRALGEKARRRIQSFFSIQAVTITYQQLYENIISHET